MKILVLINRLELGGGEVSSVLMANALAANGETEVEFAAGDGPLRERLSREIRFHDLGERVSVLSPRTWRRLRKITRTSQPDVIHVHGARLAVAVRTALRVGRTRPPIVMSHHSRGFGSLPPWLANRLLRASCNHAVAISGEMRDELVSVIGKADRVSVIPHALPPDSFENADDASKHATRQQFDVPEDALVMFIASRLVEGKGLEIFLETVESVNRESARPVFGIIAGEGPLRPVLEARKRAMAHGERVLLPGFQPDVRPLLQIADIVLLPSEEEMLSVFLIEAAAAGVPIVCSDLPGNREVVSDGVNGLVVTDPGTYSDAVRHLLEDEEQRARMGIAGQQLAAGKFSSDRVAEQLVDLYRTLLD